MEFLLVREPVRGRIVHQEIVNPTDHVHARSDPFWERLTTRIRELEEQYPDAEVINGFGLSIEAFLDSYPEYREIVPAKD